MRCALLITRLSALANSGAGCHSRPVSSVLHAIYHVRCEARSIEDRARAIAVEQSVEMPVSAIDDDLVLSEIVGRVLAIDDLGNGLFAVRIALATETVGGDAGQLLNMLFGNSSIHDDVALHDVEFPADLVQAFGGPRHGLEELRLRAGAGKRAMTCSALKPQGVPTAKLAELARRFALGGIDYIKDDHGLADQAYSPFAARAEVIAAALRGVGEASGHTARYAPSLSGDLDGMRRQVAIARSVGIDTVMVAPMIMGFSNFHRLVRENPAVAFMAHPTMAGAARIAPPLLIGKLFRLLGADAVIFPNHGGRFGYSSETCRQLARAALQDWDGLRACVPVPAGGMTPERVPEMLDFYGADIMLLIGGGLVAARERLTKETAAFVAAVQGHQYEQGHDARR
jgi:ribulose-bisphosphate carboxylase large chain